MAVISEVTLRHLDNCFRKVVNMRRSKIVISGDARNGGVVTQWRCIRPYIEPEGAVALNHSLDHPFIGCPGGKILACCDEMPLVGSCKRLDRGASCIEQQHYKHEQWQPTLPLRKEAKRLHADCCED